MRQSPLNWPVDGHVHFYRLDRVGPTLDAASANFQAAAGRVEGALGAILLTQAANDRVFEQLATTPVVGGWSLAPARDEPGTLIARQGSISLAIVCGRQVRAADGLEVLALGTREVFPDGLPFAEAVARVQRSGALTVVPWGFGKWLGRRGRRMEAVLDSMGCSALCVGDNGSRLGFTGVPAQLRVFEGRGFRVLPGTDPFPFGGDCRRVGSFGFMAEAGFDEVAPWRRLREWLLGRTDSPKPYGRACGPGRFVVNQVGIQVYNRLLRRRSE